MASIDMASLSLDEIIQKNRSGGRKSGGSGGGGFGGRRRSGPAGARKAIDKGQKFFESIRTPANYSNWRQFPVASAPTAAAVARNSKQWDSDKFFEVYSGRGGPAKSGKLVCRLSNIPFNVTQEDLNDLFENHRLSRVALHYDFRGKSLGTAEVHGQADVIRRLVREFSDVQIDGRSLQLTVVNEGGSTGAASPQRRASSGPSRVPPRRTGGGGAGKPSSGSKRDGGKKPKLTAEELDRELDEYMKTSQHK